MGLASTKAFELRYAYKRITHNTEKHHTIRSRIYSLSQKKAHFRTLQMIRPNRMLYGTMLRPKANTRKQEVRTLVELIYRLKT